jgi:predicted porin
MGRKIPKNEALSLLSRRPLRHNLCNFSGFERFSGAVLGRPEINKREIHCMNKRLIAVAVAGALTAPVAAFAQSSVTISGLFKGGFESTKLSNSARTPNSSTAVVDDSSRIVFNVVEDLGGGLQAIGQYDVRITTEMGGIGGTGNNHVGLRSKQWGRIFVGRQDLHYFNRESDMTAKGSLRSDSISILAFAGGGATAIAGATRTANVVHYTTPNFGGFTLIAAYTSSGGGGADGDIASGVRKGSGWNINPNMAGGNWQVGYSYWTSKPDAALAGEQRGDRLYGSYRWGGLKVGLAWDKSRIRTGGTGDTSRRSAWSLPVSYTWGNHSIHAHYDRAGDDKVMAGDEKARMFAVSYAYDLSKRTSAAFTYARINNNPGAMYNFFTGVGLGGQVVATVAGEDPRMWGVTLRHAF